MFVGNIPKRSPTSPIPGIGRHEGVHAHALVLGFLIQTDDAETIKGPVPAIRQGVPKPDLLGAQRAVAAQLQHQLALFAKLVQLADFLGLVPESLPPGGSECAPCLAVLVGGLIELIEVSQETGNPGNIENASHDRRPSLEGTEARAVQLA